MNKIQIEVLEIKLKALEKENSALRKSINRLIKLDGKILIDLKEKISENEKLLSGWQDKFLELHKEISGIKEDLTKSIEYTKSLEEDFDKLLKENQSHEKMWDELKFCLAVRSRSKVENRHKDRIREIIKLIEQEKKNV